MSLRSLISPRIVLASTLMLCAAFLSGDSVNAQDRDLHIETFVYGTREKLVSENLTLFTNGRVYDFRRDPASHEVLEVAVYDPARQRFDLIDVVGRRRMSISESEILELLAQVVANPEVTRRDPMLFDAEAMQQMEETYDEATGWITLRTVDGRLSYRARGAAPRNPDSLAPYISFTDWYSRLNGTNPGKMPPFARLQLNQKLLRYGFLPEQVELRYSPPGTLIDRTVEATSKHFFTWGLSPSDQALIEKIGEWINYPSVEIAHYFVPDAARRR